MLIIIDGKILLGVDDKVGVVEIMIVLVVLKGNFIFYGEIKVVFMFDEEVGKGVKYFDVEVFGVQWVYMVDGGGVGELEFENFNVVLVNIKIVGNNVYFGMVKGVMVNVLLLVVRIYVEVLVDEVFEIIEGYEGFYYLVSMKGIVDWVEMYYIICDFDCKQFEVCKCKMMEIVKKVGKGLYLDCYIELVIEDSYYNMCEKVVEYLYIFDIVQQVMCDCYIMLEMKLICGGIDGV